MPWLRAVRRELPPVGHSLSSNLGQIDKNRCHHCGLCLGVRPQGTIAELTHISWRDLQEAITGLKGKIDDPIAKIDKLRGLQQS